MLTITVPGKELWNKEDNCFEYTAETVLDLEHSLASLSKWESIFKKPFLAKGERSNEEAIGYIIAMTLTPNVPDEVYARLSDENMNQIADYINDSKTATWFNEKKSSPSRQTITSELIYYWMYSAGIPKEHENDHLSRLFTLLRVFSVENQPKEKTRPSGDALSDRARLNAQRKAELGTSG